MTDEHPPVEDEQAIKSDDDIIESSDARWKLLASFLSLVLNVGFLAMVFASAVGKADLTSVPDAWFYVLSLLVLTAGGWTFGTDLVEVYRK